MASYNVMKTPKKPSSETENVLLSRRAKMSNYTQEERIKNLYPETGELLYLLYVTIYTQDICPRDKAS